MRIKEVPGYRILPALEECDHLLSDVRRHVIEHAVGSHEVQGLAGRFNIRSKTIPANGAARVVKTACIRVIHAGDPHRNVLIHNAVEIFQGFHYLRVEQEISILYQTQIQGSYPTQIVCPDYTAQ